MKLRIEPVAVDCLMLRLFDAIDEAHMPWLLAATQRLRETFGAALIDLVPSYTTLMLHYDLEQLDDGQARSLIGAALHNLEPARAGSGTLHRLPVWYDASVGPELPQLAERSGLGIAGVIERHSSREYQVFALGFAPGFAFMGLVEPQLASPRLATPRQRVPAGSLGIADRQTAVYPSVSPGGWNLIGRMPIPLFDREEGRSLLQPGDRVRFEPVDREAFIRLGGDDTPFEVQP